MLTSAWKPLNYHPVQSQLWRSKARFKAVAAGRGSGKTEIARRYVVRWLKIRKEWSDPMYFYALPTMAQARRVAWRPLLNLIPPHWIKGEPNKSEMRIETIYGTSLTVCGMDKPQRIEGVQWDGGIIDESCDQKPGIFDLNILPALSWREAWCWRIGVPKRFGCGARDFRAYFEKAQGGHDPELEAFTWPSSDILTPEQLRFAQENLDAKDFREQYKASWEDAGGSVFHAFDEVLNVRDTVYDPSLPLLIGSDFNVDPMAWVIGQQKGNELHIFDEIWERNTNTPATMTKLWNKYKEHKEIFYFYGDATGRARDSTSTESDYVQIKNDKRFLKSRVVYPDSNPARADRFSACNAMFCSANDTRRCFINPRCKRLISDLQERSYEQGTRSVEDVGDVGHISDALGYLIYARFPIRLAGSGRAPEVKI